MKVKMSEKSLGGFLMFSGGDGSGTLVENGLIPKAIFAIMFFNTLISPDLYSIALPAKSYSKISGEYLYFLYYPSVEVLYPFIYFRIFSSILSQFHFLSHSIQ